MHREPIDDPEDYGYDLAHEVPRGPDAHGGRDAHPPTRTQASRDLDPFTDYGSDEAHDL
jgi:hypothetical protein